MTCHATSALGYISSRRGEVQVKVRLVPAGAESGPDRESDGGSSPDHEGLS